MNLLPAIKAIKIQISDIERSRRQELEPYLQSLDCLRHINTTCEMCDGTGKLHRRTCAEDEGSYYTCEACYGTGETKALSAVMEVTP